MPRVPPLDRPATYEDLIEVSDLMIAEIVDGELYATRRLAPRPAYASTVLGALIGGPYDLGRGGPGGWRILYGAEIHLGSDVLVPDWAGWRRTRVPRLPETAYFTLSPDWVCEVLSPSTASLDRVKKLTIYAREGVDHAWLIDPAAGTLEVLGRADDRWTILATHFGSAVVRAEPFFEIELDLGSLWADE